MAVDLSESLVIGIASSALFDLSESQAVFDSQGEQAYRAFQEGHLDEPLPKRDAFPFIRGLLTLNDLGGEPDAPLVEVIVMSRNDPDTGLRVMRSVQHYELPMTRAVFMRGKSPYKFMPAYGMSLFLSANEQDVNEAVSLKLPAGRILRTAMEDDPNDHDLRIAFDFDGVLGDDASERVFQHGRLVAFKKHEVKNVVEPHDPGPLRDFLKRINVIQRLEEQRKLADDKYRIRVHVSIVTARDAPAHERAVLSLKSWGVTVNDAFFFGGIAKAPIIEILRPHIFFEDQMAHLEKAANFAPSVHVPYGVAGALRLTLDEDAPGEAP